MMQNTAYNYKIGEEFQTSNTNKNGTEVNNFE